ncbi:MAG: glycoside hydrolase family 127 protein, partial [Clostridia bacterium]|nr:glycoside hydrolase family 127 protein [Clostridia bacterium]
MERIDFSKTVINGGFWKQKQDMVRNSTVKAVYNRFKETGRFDAFRCDWKEGMPNKPHFYWDSDVAKWIEGVAYMLMSERDAELEAIIDEVVDNIEKNQYENGYFNSYYITIEPENIFTNRDRHELYCL